jgi:hypothetical protein
MQLHLDEIGRHVAPGAHAALLLDRAGYGIEGQGWFLSFHCFTKYVKVTFFRGTSLRPLPPGESDEKPKEYDGNQASGREIV